MTAVTAHFVLFIPIAERDSTRRIHLNANPRDLTILICREKWNINLFNATRSQYDDRWSPRITHNSQRDAC